MSTEKELSVGIEKLRNLMYRFLEEKDVLTDVEIIVLTQEIDNLLEKYDVLLDIA